MIVWTNASRMNWYLRQIKVHKDVAMMNMIWGITAWPVLTSTHTNFVTNIISLISNFVRKFQINARFKKTSNANFLWPLTNEFKCKVLSCDGRSFSGLQWAFILLQCSIRLTMLFVSKFQRLEYGHLRQWSLLKSTSCVYSRTEHVRTLSKTSNTIYTVY
jgi:hypothetical protein